MTTDRFDPIRRRFRDLHGADADTFVIPNPWDVGSARILEAMGFVALATTSSGFAATLGRHDQHVTRDELVAHVAAITAAVDLPVNVDAENGYATDLAGVAETVELLAEAGAAGLSIEDFDPATGAVSPLAEATERIEAAAHACHGRGIVLTARAENHLYGVGDLDDTITRLLTYRDAGADAVYAPGLSSVDDIARVVTEVGVPVNVLALPNGPTVGELAAVGVRRVSTGGSLAWAAYGALVAGARELLEDGTSTYAASKRVPRSIVATAFADRGDA
jgi:2-methylisocitrate lyase-like PEP mutase family enzyme